jgi:integrase
VSALSYDVSIYTTQPVNGARGKAYRVRWSIAKQVKSQTFGTRKLADSFRSDLMAAANRGEAFIVATGLPASMTRKESNPTWFDFAIQFTDMKWPDASPRHRHSTAEGLVMITTTLVRGAEAPPNLALLRKALKHWAFNTTARATQPTPPPEYADAIAWITKRSRPVRDLADPDVLRHVLGCLAHKLDGKPAADATLNVRRAALSSALTYAVERKILDVNPLADLKTTKKRQGAQAVDLRVVANHRQAQALLDAVRVENAALEAFLGSVYYAAMRPGEVRNLREADLHLPQKGWGEAVLNGSYQDSGKHWTDNGALGEERELKHRAKTDTRPVPLPPQLVALYRRHIADFGVGPGGWLFVTRCGKFGRPLPASLARPIPLSTVNRAFQDARAKAFSQKEQESPVARRASFTVRL